MALDPRIRIMHVVQSLDVGGLENGVVNLLNRLDSKAFNHMICCLTHGGRLVSRIQGENIKVVEVGLRADKFRFPVVTLRRFIRKFAPDILHTRGWSTVDGIIAARLAGVARVIHGEHGREATDPDGLNRKRNLIRRCLSPMVDHFVTVSEDLRSWLTGRVGISPHKVTTIHNGVDTRKFAPHSPERCAKSLAQGLRGQSGQAGALPGKSPVDRNRPAARAVLRQALCVPAESVVIGTVGRLDPVKDHRSLLRAFAPLAQTGEPVRLVIVGEGPMRGEIESEIRALNIGANVHLLGERDDVADLLGAYDVFTMTSIAEGISNTVLEAMASGLPVVATRVGGNVELIEDGAGGRLVESKNVPAMTAALAAYVGDAELRRRHGRAARARAESKFSLDRMAAQYAALYRRVVNGTTGLQDDKEHSA